MIAQGADMQTVVRLLCLASITAGGIKTKVLESAKREILQVRVVSTSKSAYFIDLKAQGIWLQLLTDATFPSNPPASSPPT